MGGFVYATIFILSFIILALQVVLGVIFSALLFTPFFTVSFSLLGLTLAGTFVYLKYHDRGGVDLQAIILRYLYILGLLLLFYTVLLRNFSLIPFIYNPSAVSDSYWNRMLIVAIGSSLSIGLVFIFSFFSLGVIYSLVYKNYSQQSAKIYLFDLMGASLGCVFGTIGINYLPPSSALLLLSLLVFCLLFIYEHRLNNARLPKAAVYILASLVLLIVNMRTDFLEIKIRYYNPSWAKPVPYYQEIWHRWNAYSRTSLLHNLQAKYPANVSEEFPEYIFSILYGKAKVVPFNLKAPYSLKPSIYNSSSAFSFLLKEPKNILVLMAGAGREMVEAYSYSEGRTDITGVELNSLIIDKAKSIPGGNLAVFFNLPNIHMVNQEGRSYIESSDKKFDSIILSLSGATSMQCLGIASDTAQYLYTKEAFESYLKHLNYGGTIIVVDGNKIKVLAMVKSAFEKLGVRGVARKVIILGNDQQVISGARAVNLTSYDTLGLVIKSSDFTREEVEEIRLKLGPINQHFIYNPYFTREGFGVFEDLLKSRDLDRFVRDLSARYNRNLLIPHDDAPFVHIMTRGRNPFRGLRWGQFLGESSSLNKREEFFSDFMVFFMDSLLVLGLVFILLPLVIRAKKDSIIRNYKALIYFAILGLGFIFVEIAVMQSFVLLMGNPIYSFALVLASLLASTGMGSWLSGRLFQHQGVNFRKLSVSAALLLCCYFVLLPGLNRYLLWLPLWAKFLITVVFIFPLGITLGAFFPQGLKTFSDKNRDLIPIAWGINGYMGIMGSLLCINLSRSAGFSIFLLYAAFLYITIVFFHPKTSSS
ncbi:MAG TPA: hypothetical protein VMD04_04955 [Candidatus Margulisiibacteriota bacterium]|nr:hypothetical protein [Candidatus Margulisiibacteriota bacterium]